MKGSDRSLSVGPHDTIDEESSKEIEISEKQIYEAIYDHYAKRNKRNLKRMVYISLSFVALSIGLNIAFYIHVTVKLNVVNENYVNVEPQVKAISETVVKTHGKDIKEAESKIFSVVKEIKSLKKSLSEHINNEYPNPIGKWTPSKSFKNSEKVTYSVVFDKEIYNINADYFNSSENGIVIHKKGFYNIVGNVTFDSKEGLGVKYDLYLRNGIKTVNVSSGLSWASADISYLGYFEAGSTIELRIDTNENLGYLGGVENTSLTIVRFQ